MIEAWAAYGAMLAAYGELYASSQPHACRCQPAEAATGEAYCACGLPLNDCTSLYGPGAPDRHAADAERFELAQGFAPMEADWQGDPDEVRWGNCPTVPTLIVHELDSEVA